jgi:general secretion pathway protein I
LSRARSSPIDRRDAGFTIIEVLVALGILGLVLASAWGLLSTGAVGVARADHTTRAVLVAESVLAALGSNVDPQDDGLSDTSDDGFSWRVSIRPYSDETTPPPKPAALRLYRIEIAVQRGRGLDYRVVTLGLGRADDR